eukprot:Skav204597  [mRNA]  locus=scaffold672:207143:208415:+ [translate_table: standard]
MVSCTESLITGAMYLAVSMPKTTGADDRPNFRSPSTLLKSLTIAMPTAATEYHRVKAMISGVASPKVHCPANHGSAM